MMMSDSEDDMDMEQATEEELKNSDVVTKYKTAGDIASKVLSIIIKETVPGVLISTLCETGDRLIEAELKSRYSKGKLEKGVAFPTSVSVNNIAGHFSPLSDDKSVIVEGDLVKIDLAVHIDGYIAAAAHTIIAMKQPPSEPITGRKADAICAAHFAAEAALRLLRPGHKNTEVTEAIAAVAASFNVTPVEGVLSHQMKRFVIDGNKAIINKATPDQKVDEFTFEEYEVYAIDIVMSTGEGRPRETNARTTIYKRAVDQSYLLKIKASRYVFNEINSRFATFPFTLRALDEKRAKLGIVECVNHDLVHPYPVLFEKAGEFIAQFKFTALILPSQTHKLSSFQLPFVKSEYSIEDPKLKGIFELSTKKKTSKPKRRKKKRTTTSTQQQTTTTSTQQQTTTTTTQQQTTTTTQPQTSTTKAEATSATPMDIS